LAAATACKYSIGEMACDGKGKAGMQRAWEERQLRCQKKLCSRQFKGRR